jgi:hypothetical protein
VSIRRRTVKPEIRPNAGDWWRVTGYAEGIQP